MYIVVYATYGICYISYISDTIAIYLYGSLIM